MEMQPKKHGRLLKKWACYGALLVLAAVLQTMPGFLTIGAAKPVFLLPLCLAVALQEDTFSGALYGALGGLLWEFCAGRTVGLLSLTLMLLCLAVSVATEVWLQNSIYNYVILCALAIVAVLGADFLLFYAMRGYPGKMRQLLSVVFPSCVFTVALSPVWRAAAAAVYKKLS